jgi:hypothetical protein
LLLRQLLFRELSEEKRKHNKKGEKDCRQCADAFQILLCVGVIGVEFNASRGGARNRGSLEFVLLSHFNLLDFVIASYKKQFPFFEEIASSQNTLLAMTLVL